MKNSNASFNCDVFDDIRPNVRPDLRRHPALIVAVFLALIMVLMLAAALWQVRRDVMRSQESLLTILASARTDEMERGLMGVWAALQATRTELRTGRLRTDQVETISVLQSRAGILPLVRKLWVADERGHTLVASRTSPTPPPESFSPALANLADDMVAISAPYTESDEGDPVVALAVRAQDSSGRNTGWIFAEMPVKTLAGAFSRIELEPSTHMEVLRADGLRLAGGLGASFPAEATAEDGESGLVKFDDGTLRFFEVRALQHFPVRLLITRDTHGALTHWQELARFGVALTLFVLAVLAALLIRMLRAEAARHAAQYRLEIGRDRAALAFAAAQEGNWDWMQGSEHVYLSPRMKELMGLPRDSDFASVPLEHWFKAMHAEDVARLRAALESQLEPGSSGIDMPVRVKQTDDRCHWVRLRGNAARDEHGHAQRVAGVAFDITEERERAAHTQQLEAQLGRARKLESLGTLAGGVAHDFNNILAAVVGFGEMARHSVAEGSDLARHLDQVLLAGMRGKSVVERILAFTSGGTRPKAVFAVQPVVHQVLDLLAATIDNRVQLSRQIEAPEACICGDATQVFEAVMNLCTNALQAMPVGGVLTVGLRRVNIESERWVSHGKLETGDYVQVSVADTGEGIAAEHIDRLFEPFFTTRAAGAGTGLGLAVAHSAVQAHCGAADVVSALGQGSIFTLYFPLSEQTVDASLIVAETAEAPLGAGQVVLVLDDEPALMALTEEYLAQLGYEPVGFTSASEALAEFSMDPDRFDLVLTDEVMPDIPGTRFAAQVHALRPKLPIVLASGYGGPQLVQRAHDAGICKVLVKPLQLRELAHHLADALGSKSSAPDANVPQPQKESTTII